MYTSATLSLASLEILVHTDKDVVPDDLVQIEVELPNNLRREAIEPESLPSDWRAYPAPAALRRLGAAWLDRGKTAVLEVPSAVIPSESNYLLNPLHRHASRFHVVSKEKYELDPCLVR